MHRDEHRLAFITVSFVIVVRRFEDREVSFAIYDIALYITAVDLGQL